MHSKNFALATNEFQKSQKSQKCDILKTAFCQNFKCLVCVLSRLDQSITIRTSI